MGLGRRQSECLGALAIIGSPALAMIAIALAPETASSWVPFGLLCYVALVVLLAHHDFEPRRGHCPRCGYDLRGYLESQVCAECGEPIPRED